MMRKAIIKIGPEILTKLLRLPKGAVVSNIRSSWNSYGVVEILLEGVGWELAAGDAVPIARPATMTMNESGDVDIDWHLPNV
jgi:hypothetical protein